MQATDTVRDAENLTGENVIHRRRATDWQKPAEPTMNAAQLGIVLNDIAGMAKNVERFAVMLVGSLGVGQSDDEAHLAAIEAMAQRIGWAADMAVDRIEGSGSAVYGDAERWMMPPAFHWHEAKTEEVAA